MKLLSHAPNELKTLQNPPTQIYYKGNTALLESPIKVSILGTRKPNQYTKTLTHQLAYSLSKRGAVIVSGGALGVDIIAHSASYPNTIMVSPSGLDIIYPRYNKEMIEKMMMDSLVLSEYDPNFMPFKNSFLERNRIVVALGQCVIIPQADIRSGSFNSANLAIKMGIPIYVLPHRLGESEGTNLLLARGEAEAIYDVDSFVTMICGETQEEEDEILTALKSITSYEDAINQFGSKILEYEIAGKISQKNGRIIIL